MKKADHYGFFIGEERQSLSSIEFIAINLRVLSPPIKNTNPYTERQSRHFHFPKHQMTNLR